MLRKFDTSSKNTEQKFYDIKYHIPRKYMKVYSDIIYSELALLTLDATCTKL